MTTTAQAKARMISPRNWPSQPPPEPPENQPSHTDMEHPLLSGEETSALARQVRAHRTMEELRQALPDEATPHDIAQAAQLAAQGADADLAERCRELLPSDDRKPPGGWGMHWQNIAQQADQARETLARCNQRLVMKAVRAQHSFGIDTEDLMQEGNVGLLTAIERYDERTGNRFSTYATWWIRQSIQRGIAQHGRTIRLPQHLHDRARYTSATKDRLTSELGREPTTEEIAHAVGIKPHQAQEIMALDQHTVSLENPGVGPDGERYEDSLRERYWLSTEPGPEEETLSKDLRSQIGKAVEGLEPRIRHVILSRFGLDGLPPRTLVQVGEETLISRERVRQLQAQGIRQLRNLLSDQRTDLLHLLTADPGL